jgi:hypothetical protein
VLKLRRQKVLECGAIDLRLTPEGEYVFLESILPVSFLWIEDATGQKTAAGASSALGERSDEHKAFVPSTQVHCGWAFYGSELRRTLAEQYTR